MRLGCATGGRNVAVNDNDPVEALDAANGSLMSAALMIQSSREVLNTFLKDMRKLETARESEIPPKVKENAEFCRIIQPVYDAALKFLSTWEIAAEKFKAFTERKGPDIA
jgi:hypothetical protein